MRIGSDKREATAEELAALFDESRPLRFESLPALGAAIADIDEAHLWSFVREFTGDAFENAECEGYPTAEVLARDLLLATTIEVKSFRLWQGCCCLAATNASAQLLPRSEITATRFAGDNIQSPVVERIKITGNLLTIYEASLRFIQALRGPLGHDGRGLFRPPMLRTVR